MNQDINRLKFIKQCGNSTSIKDSKFITKDEVEDIDSISDNSNNQSMRENVFKSVTA